MSSESKQESERLGSESRFSDMESFHSQYVVLNSIGHGVQGEVKLARHRLTGMHVAVKIIHKRQHWCRRVSSEVEILMMANHPNIVSLLQVIETEKSIYLIMELAKGKPLYQHIQEAGHLEEDEARRIFKQILSAVNYCHDQDIIHRDIKPDNIMIDNNGKIKIIDFGLSTQVMSGQKLRDPCGTYQFSAPEVLLGRPYDGPKIDVWSLGVVLYYMVVGRLPFPAAKIPQLQRQVVLGNYSVPPGLSIELQDLISFLLTGNPKHRPTIAEAMNHPWLQEDSEEFPDPCEKLIPLKPDPAIVKAMEHIGFPGQEVKDSVYQRKFNSIMALYLLLREQALQECDSPTQAQPMNPWITPFPSLDDPATFPLGRRRRSEPILPCSSSNTQVSESDQKVNQRERRVSRPGVLPCWPLQTTPTMGQAHIHSRSLPSTYSMPFGSEKSSRPECIEDDPSTSAEFKPVPSRGRPTGFKGWGRKIGNVLRNLCCCLPQRRLRQDRVFPQT